jgi:hypothetical protein
MASCDHCGRCGEQSGWCEVPLHTTDVAVLCCCAYNCALARPRWIPDRWNGPGMGMHGGAWAPWARPRQQPFDLENLITEMHQLQL